MIHVTIKAEPSNFDAQVRQPGIAFLRSCPVPHQRQWRGHTYWKAARNELYQAYGGICAYMGEWIPLTTGSPSVDHYIPKSQAPNLAYEWQNFRLATQKANLNKGDASGLADPCLVQPGWFVLDLPSCLIKPGGSLSPVQLATVIRSIEVLRLNDDEQYVQSRYDILDAYASGDISIRWMRRRYPYLAQEITRQNLLPTDVGAKFKKLPRH